MNSILNVLALIFVLGVGFNYLMKLIEEVKKMLEQQHVERTNDLHDIRDYLRSIARRQEDLDYREEQGIPIMKVQDGLIYLVNDD